MKKAAIIGHFAFGLKYFDGQTVKTKIVADELCRQFGEEFIERIDTHGGVKNLIKAPVQVLRTLCVADNVIILPAHNGLRVYAPLLAFAKKFFKKKRIHYVVIGGWLPAFLKKHKCVKRALEKFDCIYAETTTMKKALEAYGFSNIYVMPNCKRLDILSEESLVYSNSEPYRFCTFSRVMKEKGIEEAINAVCAVNASFERTACTLDIYGQVDSGQTIWFDELEKRLPKYIRYCGCVDADKSVEVLQNYYALLFPTRFFTEGIPGTIIDAYAAGIPVISSKWESFSDVVDEGITGVGYKFDNNDELLNILLQAVEKPNALTDMKMNCIEKAKEYMPQTAIRVLSDNLT